MNPFASARALALSLLLLSSLLTGCFGGSNPTFRYYTLEQAPQTLATQNTPKKTKSQNLQFILLPIIVPERLNTNSVVIRETNDELRPLQTHLWAAELPFEITAAIGTRLEEVAGARNVSNIVPAPNTPVYRIRFHVQKFDLQLGENATLFSNWSISSQRQKNAVLSCQSRNSLPIGATVSEAVAGQQALLAEQAQALAVALSQLHRNPSTSCP